MGKTTETVDADFVAPRHLADGGDPAWAIVSLHRGCGWSQTRNPNLVTHTRREVPAAQVAFALEDRIRTLAARHTVLSAPPSVPQQPPVGPGRTH